MKPFRGKRRGPQSPPVGFSPPAARRLRRLASARSPARSSARGGGRTFGGRSATIGSLAVKSRRERCPVAQAIGVIVPDGVGRPADRGRLPCAAGRGAVASGVRSNCGDCRQCPLTAGVRGWRRAAIGSGSVANRSVACPTRLETRTKESNMCASQWVLRNPEAQ